MSLKWLEWTQQLQAIAQNGLTYSQTFSQRSPAEYGMIDEYCSS